MGKKRVGKVPKACRHMAVGRLNPCKHIVALAKDLGITRRLLSRWREEREPRSSGEGSAGTSREATRRNEVSRLKRV